MARFIEYSRLLRLPGLGGLSVGPIFGALSLTNIDVVVNFKIITLLFLIGIFKSIYGFVLNDYMDVEIDKLSPESDKRPLVKGTIAKSTALIICALCVVGVFAIVFIFFYKNYPSFYLGILCIILAAILGTVYNVYGKKIIGSDFLVGTSEGLFVLVGALLVVGNETLSIFTWVIFILVFNQYLFMNAIVGGIKDADHDYKKNVKNIALSSGVKVTEDRKIFIPNSFKAFGLGIRFLDAFIVFVPFAFYGVYVEIWAIALLAILVVLILYLSIKLLSIKTFSSIDQELNLFGLQGILRYSLIPVLLIPMIGVLYAVLLMVFPLVWYIVFTILSGKKLFQQVM